MNLADLFRDTFQTLWAHKLRTFLTMFGIAWGIVSITLMLATGEGLRIGLQRQSQSFAKDVMIVFAGRTSLQVGGMRAGRRVHWEASDYFAVGQDSPACRYVLPELGNNENIRSLYNSGNLEVTGSLPPFAEIRSVDVAEGRFYNDEDNAQGRRVAFVGSDARKQLFASHPAVGQTLWINSLPYEVIGVMREKQQNSSYDGPDVGKIFVPFGAMIRDFRNKPPASPLSVDRLLVQPRSRVLHEDCVRQVRRSLARLHDFDPQDKEAAGIWDTVKEAKANELLISGMEYFLGAVGITTLFLGGISVMNTMLVAVRERTREIGIRKAVGATRGSILGQFFAESAIVVFTSGAIGMGIAYGLCALVDLLPMPPFFAGLLPNWTTAAASVGLLGVVAVCAACYPASRAASVDPIEALRHEAGG
jgi:putative ABC transport system permease protein